jgi:hypothetical protein
MLRNVSLGTAALTAGTFLGVNHMLPGQGPSPADKAKENQKAVLATDQTIQTANPNVAPINLDKIVVDGKSGLALYIPPIKSTNSAHQVTFERLAHYELENQPDLLAAYHVSPKKLLEQARALDQKGVKPGNGSVVYVP